MDMLISKWPFLLFFAALGWTIWSLFTKRGRGRMLGGQIIATATGEIVIKDDPVTSTLMVHAIEAKNGQRHIGIEISDRSIISAHVTPIQLSKSEAESLVRMLNEMIKQA